MKLGGFMENVGNLGQMSGKTRDNLNRVSSGFSFGLFELVAMAGFLVVGISTFLNFTPVEAKTWNSSGAGLPVLFSCLAGALLMLRKNHFVGFFVAIISGFFLVHEIIIIYDNKAVELGRELGANGWFRLVLDIYIDAFRYHTGAFWGLVGILVALTSICIGWVLEIVRANNSAAAKADVTAEPVLAAKQNLSEASEETYSDGSAEV